MFESGARQMPRPALKIKFGPIGFPVFYSFFGSFLPIKSASEKTDFC